MQTAEQGSAESPSLSEITLIDPKVLAWPEEYYAAMRRQDPVHYDDKFGMYLVTRHEDLQTVLRNPTLYSSQRGFKEQYAHGYADEIIEILKTEGGGFFPEVMITDPPYHTRIRRLLEKAFTANRVATLEPGIAKLAGGLIDKFAHDHAEVVREFAAPLTIGVICEQLGIDQVDAEKIQQWSFAAVAQIGRMQSREQARANAREVCAMQNYLRDRIEERRAEKREDMISDLVHARIDDDENPELTFPEVMALVRSLLIAGNETTATALGNLFLILATQPDVVRQLREASHDDRLMTRFTEELLRIEAPVRGLPRMTTAETVLGGTKLPEGAHLLLLFAAANSDPAVFENARAFDMTRKNVGQHMSFGSGIHRCIGAALARMEIKVTLREIVRRLDDIRLDIPFEKLEYRPSVATRTLASLPLRFRKLPAQ